MFALLLAAGFVLIIGVCVAVEAWRTRTRDRKLRSRYRSPRRQPHLEDAIRAAFAGPIEQHGQIFTSYAIWKRDNETSLELTAADRFSRLNEFTRSLIIRHLWRALEKLVGGSVVIVDAPPQTWSAATDETFNDHGVDPWHVGLQSLLGIPQFIKD